MKSNKSVTYLDGIASTGSITLGNYIGSILPLKKILNKKDKFIFLIADLHGLTMEEFEEKKIKNSSSEIAKILYCALEYEKYQNNLIIYRQSDVLENGYFAYIISKFISYGDLSRMIQFKEKKNKYLKENKTVSFPASLMTYPILMISDIVLYSPDYVIGGIDQKNHIELAFSTISKFNKYCHKNVLKLFKFKLYQFAKIKKLLDPLKKMSKSDKNPKNTIFLLDNPEVAKKKILKSVTDSENKIFYDEIKKPGISNLIAIYCALENIEIKVCEEKYLDKSYGEFKNDVANIVKNFLTNFQKKYRQVTNKEIGKVLEKNGIKARNIARKKLKEIKKTLKFS
ncbi:tryptophan--tRNA ligase [symbiont of Argiope bruennichi]|uniref:tryptophan--tRNA ligase n=1 Tax=symbiont of Argiope bruennichi TaxID=2810479 RepID=UPI003DA3BB66